MHYGAALHSRAADQAIEAHAIKTTIKIISGSLTDPGYHQCVWMASGTRNCAIVSSSLGPFGPLRVKCAREGGREGGKCHNISARGS